MFDAPEPKTKASEEKESIAIIVKYLDLLVNPINAIVKTARRKGLTIGHKVKVVVKKDLNGNPWPQINLTWDATKDYHASPPVWGDFRFYQAIKLIVYQYYPEANKVECRNLDLTGRMLPGKSLKINNSYKVEDLKDLDITLRRHTKKLLKDINLLKKYIDNK